MSQATVLQCHQSQSQSCVCGKSGVEVAMVAMPHTHHDACDEPPIPTTHSSVCVQMVDMEVVVVLVMAMECDGAFMVTITTLVSCHSHSLTVKREMERGTVVDSHHLTTPSSGGWLEWLVCKKSG